MEGGIPFVTYFIKLLSLLLLLILDLCKLCL